MTKEVKKPEDTEDKDAWLPYGEEKEKEFVTEIAPQIGIDARINPEKDETPEAIDLIVDGKLTDLKTQETPFFTSLKRSSIPPQWCVTFNVNDFCKYSKTEENIDIIFWVRWLEELEGYGENVDTMEGVWRVGFNQIKKWVEDEKVSRHYYRRRKGDKRNARDSYLLDLRGMECLVCLKGDCED